ncbi:uncharacterized protein [Petaurus breviceps papuanus]|uniref:uncharacterized protein n=1 Tax=Petaurus breviceps papuanus TaxID=3040969 RepID=UPI0036D9EDC7
MRSGGGDLGQHYRRFRTNTKQWMRGWASCLPGSLRRTQVLQLPNEGSLLASNTPPRSRSRQVTPPLPASVSSSVKQAVSPSSSHSRPADGRSPGRFCNQWRTQPWMLPRLEGAAVQGAGLARLLQPKVSAACGAPGAGSCRRSKDAEGEAAVPGLQALMPADGAPGVGELASLPPGCVLAVLIRAMGPADLEGPRIQTPRRLPLPPAWSSRPLKVSEPALPRFSPPPPRNTNTGLRGMQAGDPLRPRTVLGPAKRALSRISILDAPSPASAPLHKPAPRARRAFPPPLGTSTSYLGSALGPLPTQAFPAAPRRLGPPTTPVWTTWTSSQVRPSCSPPRSPICWRFP